MKLLFKNEYFSIWEDANGNFEIRNEYDREKVKKGSPRWHFLIKAYNLKAENNENKNVS